MEGYFYFDEDEDGHWYLLNITLKDLFSKMLYDEDDEYGEKFNEYFAEYRIDGSVSNYKFMRPEEM